MRPCRALPAPRRANLEGHLQGERVGDRRRSRDRPSLAYGSGDASLLKPGAAIFIVALKKADGSLSAAG